MTFLPRQQVLSLEELLSVGRSFVEQGVKRIRITGGEPLVRQGLPWLLERLAALPGLDELTLTTNGSQLPRLATTLKDAGVSRLNISLDTLDESLFRELTRTGDLHKVLAGIDAAIDAGFDRIKLNAVILKGRNSNEVPALVQYATDRGLDISFIEEMPLGTITEHDRALQFCSSDEVRQIIEQEFTELLPTTNKTGGPSKYYRLPDSKSRIGFISPHSHNFCGDCNRVRLTAAGRLLLCLGQEHSVDLRAVLREQGADEQSLVRAIRGSMAIKPEGHTFDLNADAAEPLRFMNLTGG